MSASPKPIRAARSDYLLRSISPHPPSSCSPPSAGREGPAGQSRDQGQRSLQGLGGGRARRQGKGLRVPGPCTEPRPGQFSWSLSRQPLISRRLLALPRDKERPAWARHVRGLALHQCCTCLGSPGPTLLCRGLPWPQEAARAKPRSPDGETEEEAGKDLNPGFNIEQDSMSCSFSPEADQHSNQGFLQTWASHLIHLTTQANPGLMERGSFLS